MRAARRGGLGRRLLAALVLVLAVVGVTAWLVAGAVGPYVFHEHLANSSGRTPEEVTHHAEIAFRTAGALALAIGLAAATLAALAVSVFLTRRLGASLSALSAAARQVAHGRYEAQVPSPNMGAEFDELVEAFNQMAARLDASEDLRHRLLSDVAHELRTPVATMNAYLEGLEDGVTELDPETVGLLRAQGTRLIRLAEDLSAVSKAQSGEVGLALAPQDPAELLRLAVLAAKDRAEAGGVELTVQVDSSMPPVLADPDRMAQVLGNLVDNALRHTESGGRVVLAGRRMPDAVTLSVSDTGEGIEPQHLPYVFERFYRADSARDRASGGSGIGLAVARALVEAHGGTISAESDGRGKGARFVVTLPISAP
jgi:two-component system sensor histidine kinase BaeS